MKLSGGLTDTRLIIQAPVLGSPEEEPEQGMEDVGAEGEGWGWVGMDKQTSSQTRDLEAGEGRG